MACAVSAVPPATAHPALEPSGDFPAWLEAQGVNAEVARAMDSELGIRDYGVLRACVGDGLVRAELLATARDRLPFGFYAVLRQVVKALRGAEPNDGAGTPRWDDAAASNASSSPGDMTREGLVDVLLALLSGLSRELLLFVRRLGTVEGVGYVEDFVTDDGGHHPAEEDQHNSHCNLGEFTDAEESWTPVEGAEGRDSQEPAEPLGGHSEFFIEDGALQPKVAIKIEELSEDSAAATIPAAAAVIDDPKAAVRCCVEPRDWHESTLSVKCSPNRSPGRGLPADSGDSPAAAAAWLSAAFTAAAAAGVAPSAAAAAAPMAAPTAAAGRERPFRCDVCSRAFAEYSNYRRHTRTHTGQRPYRCEACGRAFSKRSNMKRHQRSHKGEKPFGCDVCAQGFTRLCNLKVHLLKHAGEGSAQRSEEAKGSLHRDGGWEIQNSSFATG
uniref:Zinc finger protein 629-like n=1 Tax=Petromyzon marinus TaxID=7757 RepID=A0AAJ7T4D3_PETMA|nr:zinc finger protein 629-like [Petromyzon marinus]XP_032811145.1 zinc finger protein 629-like [Petromyzon marinus]XP_032811153.1 zinc finger protein 629-like [Petromyzon marinus]XP_032811162.1 zinc finger protein 629-like [Petromyzon marinus]